MYFKTYGPGATLKVPYGRARKEQAGKGLYNSQGEIKSFRNQLALSFVS